MTSERRARTVRVDGLAVVRRAARPATTGSGEGGSPSDGAASPFGAEAVRDRSDRVTVLFVHGAMDRAASFGRVMRRLPELDTLAVDRRGYGGSVDAGVADTLDEHVADLRAVIDWSEATRIVVVGHSLGGRLALELATAADPRVLAVASYEAPVPDLDASRDRVGGGAIEAARTGGPAAAAEHFYRRMVGDDTWHRLRPRDRAARRAEGPALLAELVDLREGPPLDLDGIALPVAVGVGERSSEALRSGSHVLQERLPHARFVEIAGAGHGAHLTHPDEFARYVRGTVELGTAEDTAEDAHASTADGHPERTGANPFEPRGRTHGGATAR